MHQLRCCRPWGCIFRSMWYPTCMHTAIRAHRLSLRFSSPCRQRRLYVLCCPFSTRGASYLVGHGAVAINSSPPDEKIFSRTKFTFYKPRLHCMLYVTTIYQFFLNATKNHATIRKEPNARSSNAQGITRGERKSYTLIAKLAKGRAACTCAWPSADPSAGARARQISRRC